MYEHIDDEQRRHRCLSNSFSKGEAIGEAQNSFHEVLRCYMGMGMSFSFSSRNASVKTLLFQRKPRVVFRSVYPKYPLHDATVDLQHLSRKAYNIRCKVKDEAKDYTFVVVDLSINYTWFCHVNEGNTHGTKHGRFVNQLHLILSC